MLKASPDAPNASGTSRYQYDGAALIAQYSTSGSLQHRWVHGPGMDEPLVRYDGSGTSNKRWLHADERGSIIAHSNTSGSLIQTNSYDAFGVPAASNDGLFQYTGQLWLEDAGVYYYKNRTYHAELGVFMQTDPIGQSGGINLYAYVGGDPVNFNDPWGLEQDPPDIVRVTGNRPDPCDRIGAVCDPDELDLLLDDLFDDDFGQIDPGLLELIEDLGLEEENSDQDGACPQVEPGPIPGLGSIIGGLRSLPSHNTARQLADAAALFAYENFSGAHDGDADAVRHFHWNYTMTIELGEGTARDIANVYEFTNPNPVGEHRMDLFNNAMGRAFAQDPRYRNMDADRASRTALANGCLQRSP